MINNKRIGISFSGGAARGIAHIGVIKALTENGIIANEVAGTSAGSIIAALYAAGVSVDEMTQLVSEANLLKVIKPGIPLEGFTDLKYLRNLVGKYIKDDSFENLGMTLYVIASNLLTGKKEVLQSGSIKDSVMASCSIPILFKPVKIDKKVLIDGGIHDNMPVDPLLQWCDFIIGVNVMPSVPSYSDEVDNMFAIGMRVFDIAISENSQLNFPKCNHVIEPKEIVDFNIYNFGAYEQLIKLGYDATIKEVPAILNKLEDC